MRASLYGNGEALILHLAFNCLELVLSCSCSFCRYQWYLAIAIQSHFSIALFSSSHLQCLIHHKFIPSPVYHPDSPWMKLLKIAGKTGKERDWLKGEDSCEKQLIKELICYYLKESEELSSLEGQRINSHRWSENPACWGTYSLCVCVCFVERKCLIFFKVVTFWSGIALERSRFLVPAKQEIYVYVFFLLRIGRMWAI